MTPFTRWSPAIILALGALFTVGVDTQRTMSLRMPLDTVVPREIADWSGEDLAVPEDEIEAAGVSAYLMRMYSVADQPDNPPWSVYVGYYDRQLQGKSIHSPKNCLPGAGWEALASSEATIPTSLGTVTVNRYLLQKDGRRALVLYWYQGRGRVLANEYLVKASLLRDAALRQRSEEALVRIVVPISESERSAFDIARRAASAIVPALDTALPG